MPRGKSGLKCYGGCCTQLRKHAAELGHLPGRGRYWTYRGVLVPHTSWITRQTQSHPQRCYRCFCELCGAEIEMRESVTGDGFRVVTPLGPCPVAGVNEMGGGI